MNFKKNLKRFMTLNRHHAEGFTLVELIVVIAILAILGGVAVPAYGGYVKKANMTADQTLASEVANALALRYYSNPNTNGGYVVLTQTGAYADEVGTEAMKAAFGDSWDETAVLKYDGWKCNIGSITAAIGNSSFVAGGMENLLGGVQDCTTSLGAFLTQGNFEGKEGAETLDAYLGGNYVSEYLKDFKDNEITSDVLANAVVFGLASQLKNDPTASAQVHDNFAQGKYLTNNWNNVNNPHGYDESNRLDHSDGSGNLLSDAANTYAALQAFSAYMDIPLEVEFDPNDPTMTIVGDLADECNRVMNLAVEKDPAKMQGYLGGQAATDADAYMSIMNSVSDVKGDFTADLNNNNLFGNDDMLNLVNGYVAVSSLPAEVMPELQSVMAGITGSAIVLVLASDSNVYSIPLANG